MTDLTITQQALEDRQVLLTVTVPEARAEKAMHDAARRLAKQYRFPGFRPGKAPYNIVAQRVGRAALLEDAVEELGPALYSEALETTGLEPFAPGNLKEVTLDPLTLKFEVPLPPTVDPGDYRSLRVPEAPPDETAIEAHVQADLEEMGQGRTSWEPVERPIAYGDLVTISLKLTVDGEVVMENDDWDFEPNETDHTLAPEFDAAFVGMSSGESKSFAAAFPDEGGSAWAGKEGHFEVAVKAVQGKTEPAYDDAFAVEKGFESAGDMLQKVREHAVEHVKADAEAEHRRQVIEALLAGATLAYPPAAVDRAVDQMAAEQEAMFKAYGFESTEELLRLQKRTQESYLADLRPDAEQRLRRELVLDAIAAREHFPVNTYALEQFLVDNAGSDPAQLAELRGLLASSEAYREFLTIRVARRKADALIQAIARGEDVPAPGAHPADEPPPVAETELAEAVEDETAEDAGQETVEETAEAVTEIEAASQPDDETEATVEDDSSNS